jgi:ubiquinone biosynthesis protein COQ9
VATLNFWLKDKSDNFEKTDVYIEKSLKAGFELLDFSALKSVFDFGKFIWSENNWFK